MTPEIGCYRKCLGRGHMMEQCPFTVNVDKLVTIQEGNWIRRPFLNQRVPNRPCWAVKTRVEVFGVTKEANR